MNTSRVFGFVLAAFFVVGCDSRRDYVAPPFFTEASFRQVHQGMDEKGVRDLLGYPASRFGPVEDPVKGSKVTWEYAFPASWKPPMQFHSFSVTFGRDGRVISTLACDSSWQASEGAQASIEALRQCRRRVGDFGLTRPDGSTNVLRASDPGLYVILLDGEKGAEPRLNSGPAWFVETMPELLQKRTIAGVKHLYIGHRPTDYGELVKSLPPESARECYLDTEPEFTLTVWDLDSRLLLYQRGYIWSLAGIYAATATQAEEDQRWLVRRLAQQHAK